MLAIITIIIDIVVITELFFVIIIITLLNLNFLLKLKEKFIEELSFIFVWFIFFLFFSY